MRKSIYLMLVAFLLSSTFAQNQLSKLHSKENLDCTTCHECETPTKTNPCLAKCPRESIKVITHKVSDAPAVFEIKNIHGEKDLYETVEFFHKEHALMSEMNDGCTTCHHYNPPGKIVKCGFCHETDRAKSNINMPDLKSAYHRQCMDCHAEWEEELKCENCHALKGEFKSSKPTSDVVKMDEPITRPATLVYETGECEKGKVATFHHNDHIDLFTLQCVDCHQDESCQSCHNQKLNFKKTSNEDSHSRCNSCHDTEKKNKCSKCHTDKETKPFNHFRNTGFDTMKYHSKNRCQSCHTKEGKYSGLEAQCQSCHNWDVDSFNHTITGLQLSEDHIDNECSDCHIDNNYSNPTCGDCHEEDEGFTVPNKLPGKKQSK